MTVLDIVPLRSLVAVASCGGFHRAARLLHLTQSAVSQHVRRLEKASGQQLVERDGRVMRFTPAGEQLLADAQKILAAHDDAVRRLNGHGTKTLTIASMEHDADRLLPELADSLRRRLPQWTAHFRLDRVSRVAAAIDDGRADAAVYFTMDGADATPQEQVPLQWYAAPGWERPEGTLDIALYDEPCVLRKPVLTALHAAGIEFDVVCEASNLAGMQSAVRSGLGIACLPALGQRPDGMVPVDGLPHIPPARLRVDTRHDLPVGVRRAVETSVRQLASHREVERSRATS